jgi:PGF-CTERM protein
MNPSQTRLLVVLVAISTLLVAAAAGGALPGALSGVAANAETDGAAAASDEPSTEHTVGYVEGYEPDDELPIDERDDAVVEDDELEAVVYRSMARVEEIRGLAFEEEVPVEVISREEFQADNDGLFTDVDDAERLQLNVNSEALFAVDRDTDAADEQEALYDGSVAGYYEPSTGQVVIVSDNPGTPELDEVILGHELLHALQDQHFDLSSYERATVDQDNAKNGLIEGDAVRVEREYEARCDEEWVCALPEGGEAEFSDLNWVLYTAIYQPYSDGPDYVDHLRDDDGWDAVDAAYDDPPASSSEVIRPGEDREPAAIEVEDRSNDEWAQYELDGELASETYGEAGMVAMFAGDAHDRDRQSVIDREAFFADDLSGYEYDQPYTDGWAGDELVTYVHDDVDPDDPAAAAGDSAYVWQSEWTSETDGEEFVEGYLQLLELHGADDVDGVQDTFVIDDVFDGAYYVDLDDETVTIVRAPSVDALSEVDSAAAPDGEDMLDGVDGAGAEPTETDDTADDAGGWTDSMPGFGAPVAVVAVALALLAVRVRTADRN